MVHHFTLLKCSIVNLFPRYFSYNKKPMVFGPLYVNELGRYHSWSSLVEGGEGSYLPNRLTTLVIALDALFLLFCIFINTTAYHLGRYEPSSPVSCRAPRTIIAAYLLAERPRKNTLKDFQNILNNQPCLVKRYFWSN